MTKAPHLGDMTHHVSSEQRLDDALERIHLTSSTWRQDLANHAPMAVDALVELGRSEAIPSFLDAYGAHLETEEPLPPGLLHWTTHLGQRTAARALSAHFEAWLAEAPMQAVLGEALPVLMKGVLGGSLHGLIRVGHAVSSIARRDTPIRRRELARALGYWASEHHPLHGEVGSLPQRDPIVALSNLTPLSVRLRVDGVITLRAAAAVRSPRFREEIATMDLRAPVEGTFDALLTGAAVWLVEEPSSRFTYLHAITATSALRQLLPSFPDEAGRREALHHHVHALAAIRCMSRVEPQSLDAPAAPIERLVEAAVASRDDHQIKLAAAIRREHVRHQDDRLLVAASAFILSC